MIRPTRDCRSPTSPTSPAIEAPRSLKSGTFARAPLRQLLERPDPRLLVPSVEVDPEDPATVTLARALVATMSASPACVELAAPQIGEMSRVLCMDLTGRAGAGSCAGLVVLANPRIVERGGNVVMVEDCLSVPHLSGPVARAASVTVEGVLPGSARRVRVIADGIEARCLLHAIDHLDGNLFVDRMLDASGGTRWRRWYA